MEPNLKQIEIEIGVVSPQLYYLDLDPSEPDSPIGSCVLVTDENRYFLITAAHVLMGKRLSRIGIITGHEFIFIPGIPCVVEENVEGDVKASNADLALYELDSDFVSVVKEKYKFLDINKVASTPTSFEITRQFIFGYPAGAVLFDHENKKIIPTPLRLRTVSIPVDFFHLEKVDPSKILLMLGDMENIYRGDEKTGLGPIEGISGCGVWEILDPFSTNPKYKLSGIFTAYHSVKKIFYSTRSGEVLLTLKRHFSINH